MMKERKKVFTTNVMLLALLEDMCKKTGKVSKEDFIDEAVDLLSEEYSNEASARNAIQYYLLRLVESGDIKVEFEDGEEMLYLLKSYSLTLAKIFPYKGLMFLTITTFVFFTFSIFWTVLTKQWMIMVICGLLLFGTLMTLISYETQPIVKARERKILVPSHKTRKFSRNLEKVLIEYLLDHQNIYGFKILKTRTKGPDFQIEYNGKILDAEVEVYADSYIYNHPKNYAQLIIALKPGKEKIPKEIEVKLINIEDFAHWLQKREDIIKQFINLVFGGR